MLYNRWTILLILSLLEFSYVTSATADKDEKDGKILLSEMFERIEASPKRKPFRLENKTIVSDGSSSVYEEPDTIYSPIIISNCTFNTNTDDIKDIVFDKSVIFHRCEDFNLSFDSCVFKAPLWFKHMDKKTLSLASFYECVFHDLFLYNNSPGKLIFFDCYFKEGRALRENPNTLLGILPFGKKINNLRIKKCEFGDKDSNSVVKIKGEVKRAIISDNKFHSRVLFGGLNVSEVFNVSRNSFDDDLGVHMLNIPKNGTNIDFSQIDGNKLCLFNYDNKNPFSNPYKAKGEGQLTDSIDKNEYYYNELMGSYNKLYNSYKARGDKESANACYIEKKHIETRKLRYEYEQNSTFRNFINYNLNRFLWVFARYGTSPTQAIVVSFYIILLFGAFYFFTHTKWDRIDRDFLLDRIRLLNEYFRSEKRFEDLHQEKEQGSDQGEPIVKELEASKGEAPAIVRLLGKGLYFISVLPRRIGKWFIRRTDFLKGRWQDLSPGRKWIVGTGAFFFSLFYGIYLILLRGLNSFVLSLNSFVTLGFGVIPVSGVARYLTILEGFIGWFLLSIFSISLINQILQF